MNRKTFHRRIRCVAKAAFIMSMAISSSRVLGTGVECPSGIYAPIGAGLSSSLMIGAEVSFLLLDCESPFILHENNPAGSRRDVYPLGIGIYVDSAIGFKGRRFSSYGPEFIFGFVGFDAGVVKEKNKDIQRDGRSFRVFIPFFPIPYLRYVAFSDQAKSYEFGILFKLPVPIAKYRYDYDDHYRRTNDEPKLKWIFQG